MINLSNFSDSKAKIITSSIRIINDLGWDSLSIKMVAEDLSQSSASIYKHFQNLNDLKIHLTLLCFRDFDRLISDSLLKNLDSKHKMYDLTSKLRTFAKKNPGLFMASMYRNDSEPEELASLRKKIHKNLGNFFRSLNVPEDKLTSVSRSFRGLVFGILLLEINHSFGLPENPERNLQEAVTIFYRGILTIYLSQE